MSTAPIDSGGPSGGINRILSQFTTLSRTNSVGATERSTNPSSTSPVATNENTWIHKFNRLDQVFSGGLLSILYRIVDITILFIGLTSNNQTCSASNNLAATSICLLVFYFIDLTIISLLSIRNISSRHSQLSDQQKLERLYQTAILRGFFNFFKLIPICIGTAYSFSSTVASTNDCELTRFCLGVVCLSTWLLILMPPAKPDLPVRRSLIIDCFFLAFVLIINCTYIGTIATAMQDVQHPTCIYNSTQDIYLGSPLKSYAYVGLILFGCTTAIHIIHLLINQLSFRFIRGRQFYIYYYAFQYLLNYLSVIVVIYYFSVGALFLFQPRSGQPCRTNAPDLYRVLLIWEWIRILAPLILIPLAMILCCLGVFLGVILSCCLPPSITVPILEFLQGYMVTSPVGMHPNPPATQENIDAVPIVVFGQEADQFNQTDCAICRTNFEANEQLKKLQCGHLFHPECVANWLLVTRICPICRRRMSVAN